MSDRSYPCFYPGEFSPPTKYHLNTVQWLLNKPEVHRVNVVIGNSKPGQLSQEQIHELWDMLLKYDFAPQAGLIKAKQQGPISHIYETFNKDKNLPAYIALDEKSSRNMKLQEKFEQFPYFGIQIIPSQFHKSSKTLMSCAQDNDLEGVKRELPDGVSDDFVQKYIEIINKNRQDPEAPEERSPYIDHKSRYMNMFSDGFWKNVFQPMSDEVLNEVISNHAKKKALEKYKKENLEVQDDYIMRYIDKFSEKQASNVFKNKDINQYKFDQLKELIDKNFPSDNPKKNSKEVDFKGSEDVVYNNNGLLILLGDLKEKCIRYGKGYPWCISRKDTNMYHSHRMRETEPSFYFVFDEDKPKEDRYHAIVIYVDNKGDYYIANSHFQWDEEVSWYDIESIQPKLKGLQKLIKHIPTSPEEKNVYQKIKNRITDKDYKDFSYTEKDLFISTGKTLSQEMILNTPKKLISKYAVTTIGNNIPKEIEKSLPPSDQKKLKDNRIREYKDLAKFIYYKEELTAKDLNIEKDLDFRNIKITSLPNNLKVGRNLYLNNTNITSLPDNLEVKGDLHLNDTKIDSLPDNLKVTGVIYINNNLKDIPKKFESSIRYKTT